MANKARLVVGFVVSTEDDCDWEDVPFEKKYSVTIKKLRQNFNTSDTTSGEIKIRNVFEIVGDSYLFKHISEIRYLVWKDQRWIIDTLELLETPRISVTIGGIYNGPHPTAEDSSEED